MHCRSRVVSWRTIGRTTKKYKCRTKLIFGIVWCTDTGNYNVNNIWYRIIGMLGTDVCHTKSVLPHTPVISRPYINHTLIANQIYIFNLHTISNTDTNDAQASQTNIVQSHTLDPSNMFATTLKSTKESLSEFIL